MFAELFKQFDCDCTRRLWAGEALSRDEWGALSLLIAARELGGHRILGPMAGPDPDTDTVSGRCGHTPTFAEA